MNFNASAVTHSNFNLDPYFSTSIISSRFSYSVLLSAAVASNCVKAGVCLTNSSEVVLGADIEGVSGHKFEGSLKKVVTDHHNSLSTRSFPEQPLEGMSAGFMFPGQNLHFSMGVFLSANPKTDFGS